SGGAGECYRSCCNALPSSESHACSLHDALPICALMIRNGIVDAIVVGGGEAAVTRMGLAGFSSMGALSTRNDDPERASRPFDKGDRQSTRLNSSHVKISSAVFCLKKTSSILTYL